MSWLRSYWAHWKYTTLALMLVIAAITVIILRKM